MDKTYDENGDVILSCDQKDLCLLADFLYQAVDTLFLLEDRRENFDLHPAVEVYRDACVKLKELME